MAATFSLLKRYVLVDPHMAALPSTRSARCCAQDLVGAAGDAEAGAADPLRLEVRGVPALLFMMPAAPFSSMANAPLSCILGAATILMIDDSGPAFGPSTARSRCGSASAQALLLDVPVGDLGADLLVRIAGPSSRSVSRAELHAVDIRGRPTAGPTASRSFQGG